MADLSAVAVSGSPRSPSKSKALAELMLETLRRHGCETRLIDLSTLPAGALVAREEHPDLAEAIETVGRAQVLVAATPTYRALYTGLLKCFFDLMPQGWLAGKVCVPLQTGAVPQHALAVDYGLRPLFMSLDGVPLSGVYATDEEFAEGAPSAELVARVEEAAVSAVRLAGAG